MPQVDVIQLAQPQILIPLGHERVVHWLSGGLFALALSAMRFQLWDVRAGLLGNGLPRVAHLRLGVRMAWGFARDEG